MLRTFTNGRKEEMNKRVKKKWLESLRSGKYSQGYQYLVQRRDHDPEYDNEILTVEPGDSEGNKYCCLGVLVDLYLKENSETWETQLRSEAYYGPNTDFEYEEDLNNIPKKEVWERWAELPEADPIVSREVLSKMTEGPGPMPDATFGEATKDISLASLNDRGVSFKTIAKVIEEIL